MNKASRSLPFERGLFQRLAPFLAVFVQIGATFLPNLGLGEPIQARSDAVRTLITPAGWAFAIWGPLFLGSAAFAVYQALPSQARSALLDRITWPAAGVFTANGVWAAYTQFNNLDIGSAIIIAIGLGCALAAMRVFSRLDRRLTRTERWLTVLPLSALAAWLSAATIVNISAMLTYYGVGGDYSQPLVTAVIVIVGGAIAAFAIMQERGNPVYALVFLWALLAIYFAGGQREPAVAYAAIASGVLVILATIARLRIPKNRRIWFG